MMASRSVGCDGGQELPNAPLRWRLLTARCPMDTILTGGAHRGPGFGEALIRIYPEKVNSFGIA